MYSAENQFRMSKFDINEAPDKNALSGQPEPDVLVTAEIRSRSDLETSLKIKDMQTTSLSVKGQITLYSESQ
jgi:hypothetical protein